MQHSNEIFDIDVTLDNNFLLIDAGGTYSLTKTYHLFKLAVDNGVMQAKSKILIDVTRVNGSIPFMDRFHFSEFLATYRMETAHGLVHSIAMVGKEDIVHDDRFGETVAINRGTNLRVFTEMNEAATWLIAQ